MTGDDRTLRAAVLGAAGDRRALGAISEHRRATVTYAGRRDRAVSGSEGRATWQRDRRRARFRGRALGGKHGVQFRDAANMPSHSTGATFRHNVVLSSFRPTTSLIERDLGVLLDRRDFARQLGEIDPTLKVTESQLSSKSPSTSTTGARSPKRPARFPSPGRTTRPSGSLRAAPRSAPSPCRWESVDFSATAGPSSPSPTISTSSPTRTASSACPRSPASPRPPSASQQLLATAFGATWSPAQASELLERAGKQEEGPCRLASRRVLQAALHSCSRIAPSSGTSGTGARTASRRSSTTTGSTQHAARSSPTPTWARTGSSAKRLSCRDEVAGAEARLAAAQELQRQLERSSRASLPTTSSCAGSRSHEQPLGWDPDLNDGVRLNVRPFVEAGVLRAKFNVNWNKDRGKNPDGSERHQRPALHPRREARRGREGRRERDRSRRSRRDSTRLSFDGNSSIAGRAALARQGAQWEPSSTGSGRAGVVPRRLRTRSSRGAGVLASLRGGRDVSS